jgi:hypothetical protein
VKNFKPKTKFPLLYAWSCQTYKLKFFVLAKIYKLNDRETRLTDSQHRLPVHQKTFFRKLSDNVLSDSSVSFQVFHWNSILKLQSFVHYQFSSPHFMNLIKYAWYAARYVEQRPGSFLTPSQFCLQKTVTHCEVPECINFSFVRCAWCKENVCFHHAIDTSHFCDNYKEWTTNCFIVGTGC